MKNLFLAFILLLFVTSCSKNNFDLSTDSISDNITSKEWIISSYIDGGKDETSHFNNYTFTFNSSNSLVASNGSMTHNGTWSVGTDDSDSELIISFTAPDDFIELSDDWKVVENTESKISLEDVSGGNGETDILVFEYVN